MESLDPAYQTWIAENLLLGADGTQLKATLLGLSIPEALVDRELAAAQNHPYVAAGRNHTVSLQKREALLKTLDYYHRLDPEFMDLTGRPLPPYADFLRDYVYRNRPGLFTGASDHWPARHWTPQTILAHVGADSQVDVQQGRTTLAAYDVESPRLHQPMRFGDFITHMETSFGNDIYMTANNRVLSRPEFAFVTQDVGILGDGYIDTDPAHAQLFLWMGPAGTVTPLHHDLTHNIFLQIFGQKRFRLYPATQVPYMYNNPGVYSPVDPYAVEAETYSQFARATPLDVTVRPGEMLYIPIAWWHHVMGETPSISLTTTRLRDIHNAVIDYPPG